MALQKSFTTSSGVTGNYWEILMQVRRNFYGDLKVNARVALWLDQAANTAKKTPIYNVNYTWNWETLAELGLSGSSTNAQDRTAVQNAIKNDNTSDIPDLGVGFFNDATIV